MTDQSETLVASWSDNAALWTRAVREGRIASRRTTDAAILAAVRRGRPQRLLDVGCGEGWLGRALTETEIVGVDVAPELIAAARAASPAQRARFLCLPYQEVVARPDRLGAPFDTIVCNFSLLDDRAPTLIAALARVARPGARLLIQTVHPLAAGSRDAEGWRCERFEAFGGGGWTEMPWYFRTLVGWRAAVGPPWVLHQIEEPRVPGAALPTSLLMVAQRA